MTAQSGGKDAGQTPPTQPLTVQEKRTAMWCHLSSLAGVIIPAPISLLLVMLAIQERYFALRELPRQGVAQFPD